MIFYFLYYFSSFHFIFIHISFLFFFFLFLVFLLHTSVHPPFFYFLFHLKNILAILHLLYIRERERETAARPPPHHRWRSRSPKGQSQWRSAFTMQHYLICRLTAARPPPHHQAGLDRLVLLLFFYYYYFFFIFACSNSTLL